MKQPLAFIALIGGASLGGAIGIGACSSAADNSAGSPPVVESSCVASGLDRDSGTSCSACVQGACNSQVASFQSGCTDYLTCVCPGGSAVVPSQETLCEPKLMESACTGTIGPLQSCEQASCASACHLAALDMDGGHATSAEAGPDSTFSCTNGSGSSQECDQQQVPSADMSMAQTGCTQVGGTAGTGCTATGSPGAAIRPPSSPVITTPRRLRSGSRRARRLVVRGRRPSEERKSSASEDRVGAVDVPVPQELQHCPLATPALELLEAGPLLPCRDGVGGGWLHDGGYGAVRRARKALELFSWVIRSRPPTTLVVGDRARTADHFEGERWIPRQGPAPHLRGERNSQEKGDSVMNIALWVAQGFAALVFLLDGCAESGDAEGEARREDALGRDVAAGAHQAARSRRGGRRGRARAPRRAAHRAGAHADRRGLPRRADARRRPDASASSRERCSRARAGARLRGDCGRPAPLRSLGSGPRVHHGRPGQSST